MPLPRKRNKCSHAQKKTRQINFRCHSSFADACMCLLIELIGCWHVVLRRGDEIDLFSSDPGGSPPRLPLQPPSLIHSFISLFMPFTRSFDHRWMDESTDPHYPSIHRQLCYEGSIHTLGGCPAACNRPACFFVLFLPPLEWVCFLASFCLSFCIWILEPVQTNRLTDRQMKTRDSSSSSSRAWRINRSIDRMKHLLSVHISLHLLSIFFWLTLLSSPVFCLCLVATRCDGTVNKYQQAGRQAGRQADGCSLAQRHTTDRQNMPALAERMDPESERESTNRKKVEKRSERERRKQKKGSFSSSKCHPQKIKNSCIPGQRRQKRKESKNPSHVQRGKNQMEVNQRKDARTHARTKK